MPTLNPIDLWNSAKKLTRQIFDLVTECELTRDEVMRMTHLQRKDWMELQSDKLKKQKEQMDRERAKSRRMGSRRR